MAEGLPRIAAQELVRALRRDGWYLVYQRGSHAHYEHDSKPGKVTVPVHSRRTLKLGTLKAIIEQAGLTSDELRRLL